MGALRRLRCVRRGRRLSGGWVEFNLAQVQEAIAAAIPEREALVWRDRRLSYGALTERTRRLANYLVLSAHKTMPRAMEALVADQDVHIDGFLCPGHVSVVTGASAFSFLAQRHGIPCVVAGFEEVDLLRGIVMLLSQLADGRSEVEIEYGRAVSPEGNRTAQEIMGEVFVECDTEWRGLGMIAGSGLALRLSYADHEAAQRLGVTVPSGRPAPGCRCGDVLRGTIVPPDCALFDRRCTPSRPLGPCMVSSEGACAAYARYWKRGRP